jgi:hypothetical protein
MSQYELFNNEVLYKKGNDTFICRLCKKELPKRFFYVRKDRSNYRVKSCKSCEKLESRDLRDLHKIAPPKSKKCDCCGFEAERLYLDHCHDTLKFRGWLCNACNLGLGSLGDNEESLLIALKYLRKT